ncbi:dihydrofolate reductase family protein [Anaerocolumna sp. AGMB13020]|uniref:dihydrofolate reductase family protein n=1 Tax=Anaerocolumna sp. AGMB13020 TaxID=3081750 RepID=UPI002954C2B7|nr:dihydrofolate reductase family protein [Anaerocolumna sp. AGMB13020]WOO34870.1 dihydrofolate reductase family protein [Anaerocolumna sp. AGMB13020]
MPRKVVLFIAESLDGYIATKEDDLEWLINTEGEGDNGYSEFYDTIDTIIMGRRTYDWILNHEGNNFPYVGKQCYVLSESRQGKDKNVVYVNGNITEFIQKLKQEEGKDIWIVGGGSMLHEFIEKRLVDEWIITVTPTILGDGIPLFQKQDFRTKLRLKGARTFNQFTELHYETEF